MHYLQLLDPRKTVFYVLTERNATPHGQPGEDALLMLLSSPLGKRVSIVPKHLSIHCSGFNIFVLENLVFTTAFNALAEGPGHEM